MSMKKIKKDDEIIVIAGKDKGKTGKVTTVSDDFVVVDGINLVKKHTKPNPAKNITGGVLSKSMPLHVSNIAIYNPESKKADRVGFKVAESGDKVRVFKSNGKELG